MRRREFVKLMAAAAASTAVPALGQEQKQPDFPQINHPPDHSIPEAAGFDQLNEATPDSAPEQERVFYALGDNNIVSEKLDPATWKPTAWGESPMLPIPGGSWDGVPMNASVEGLAGEGPNAIRAGAFQGHSIHALGEKDVRFTPNKADKIIYAISSGLAGG